MPPTHQDDCGKVLRILADCPAGGLSQDEIREAVQKTGETWSQRTVNAVLCDIRAQVSNAKVRGRSGRSITKYSLKGI